MNMVNQDFLQPGEEVALKNVLIIGLMENILFQDVSLANACKKTVLSCPVGIL